MLALAVLARQRSADGAVGCAARPSLRACVRVLGRSFRVAGVPCLRFIIPILLNNLDRYPDDRPTILEAFSQLGAEHSEHVGAHRHTAQRTQARCQDGAGPDVAGWEATCGSDDAAEFYVEDLLGLTHDVLPSEGSLEDPRCKQTPQQGGVPTPTRSLSHPRSHASTTRALSGLTSGALLNARRSRLGRHGHGGAYRQRCGQQPRRGTLAARPHLSGRGILANASPIALPSAPLHSHGPTSRAQTPSAAHAGCFGPLTSRASTPVDAARTSTACPFRDQRPAARRTLADAVLEEQLAALAKPRLVDESREATHLLLPISPVSIGAGVVQALEDAAALVATRAWAAADRQLASVERYVACLALAAGGLRAHQQGPLFFLFFSLCAEGKEGTWVGAETRGVHLCPRATGWWRHSARMSQQRSATGSPCT